MDWTTTHLPDGYTEVPPGKIASVVTFLEMMRPPAPRPVPAAPGVSLARLRGADTARYLAVYRSIGERWVWFSRLGIPEARLAALLDDPLIEAYVLATPGGDAGFMEIDRRHQGEAELVYFGLVEAAIGQGLGRRMMNEAIAIAFSHPIGRFWLHTCTLDHPGAVAFYRRSGFRPYRTAVEIADDPRTLGHIPADAWPDMPPPG